ncbi:MAG: hypothetical protein JWP87_1995, partial [Labilithrix sp.]|nr:hypothetical protein [Labilithrix sp.]
MTRLSVLALAALVGCGASTAAVGTSNTSTEANLASQANEPRINDPTAAAASPRPAIAGTAVKVGGGPKPPTKTSEAAPPELPKPAPDSGAAKQAV